MLVIGKGRYIKNNNSCNHIKEKMKVESYLFNACVFVQAGYESASGDWTDALRENINTLRRFYPELTHWGDLAIGLAFGEYITRCLVGWLG